MKPLSKTRRESRRGQWSLITTIAKCEVGPGKRRRKFIDEARNTSRCYGVLLSECVLGLDTYGDREHAMQILAQECHFWDRVADWIAARS